MYATIYEWKPYQAKEDIARIMEQYAEIGDVPGLVAHYTRRDGSGGIIISTELPEYSRSLAWSPFLRWESIPIDDVGDILPAVAEYLA